MAIGEPRSSDSPSATLLDSLERLDERLAERRLTAIFTRDSVGYSTRSFSRSGWIAPGRLSPHLDEAPRPALMRCTVLKPTPNLAPILSMP